MALLDFRVRRTYMFLLAGAAGMILFYNWLLYALQHMSYRYLFEGDFVAVAESTINISWIMPSKMLLVALGCAVTTRGIQLENTKTMHDTSDLVNGDPPMSKILTTAIKTLPLYTDLLPSFCQTASSGFEYRFYIAFDYNDPILANRSGQEMFTHVFHDITSSRCSPAVLPSLTLIKCNHTKEPAHAQNDAMMAAYLDKVDYLYRVNDDTILATQQWTEIFIQTLQRFNPPNVGVVGPSKNAKYDNTFILTYEFLHRTHVDIFGFYYPRLLNTWYADDWITHVYQPGRSLRLSNVVVMHTQTLGRRYEVGRDVLPQLDKQLIEDKATLAVWLDKAVHPQLDKNI